MPFVDFASVVGILAIDEVPRPLSNTRKHVDPTATHRLDTAHYSRFTCRGYHTVHGAGDNIKYETTKDSRSRLTSSRDDKLYALSIHGPNVVQSSPSSVVVLAS